MSISIGKKLGKIFLLQKEYMGDCKHVNGHGLNYYWMYDYSSIASKLEKIGFEVLKENNSPSKKISIKRWVSKYFGS